MRNVFVGSMGANGVFFLSYRYAKVDTALATLIGLAAIGVALFPTTPGSTHAEPDCRRHGAFRLRDGVLPDARWLFVLHLHQDRPDAGR